MSLGAASGWPLSKSAAQICVAALVLAAIGLHLWTSPDALLLRLRPGPEILVGKNFARLRELDPRLSARPRGNRIALMTDAQPPAEIAALDPLNEEGPGILIDDSGHLGREKRNGLFWSALVMAVCLLFLPGLALSTSARARMLAPPLATALLPLPGLGLLLLYGLALWLLRLGHEARLGSWLACALVAGAGVATIWSLGRGRVPRLYWKPLGAYAFVVVAAIGYSLAPPEVAADFFAGTTWRGRMTASPPDSTIPYFSAAFFIHDKDPRGDIGPYFWGWSFSSRGPATAWIDAAALNVEGLLPDDPPTASPVSTVDRQGYFVARIYGILTNALVILAAGALLAALGATESGATFGLAWVALAPLTFINVVFVWPKLLSSFFLILTLALIREPREGWRWGCAAACAALGYLTHPVAGFLLIPLFLLAATRWSGDAPRAARIRRTAGLAALAALFIAPWLLYKLQLGQQDYFALFPLGDGRGIERAASLASWLRARWLNLRLTLVPFDFFLGPSMRQWQGLALDGKTRWAVQAAKTLPGELGLSLFWLAYLRFAAPRTDLARRFRTLAIALPFLAMLVYWGYSADGLGRNCLEPVAMLLVIYTAAQQPSLGLREKIFLVALACESAAVALLPLRF